MADKAFGIGETVMLKSGGPPMTVCGVHENSSVRCQWFTEDETLRDEGFKPSCLKAVGQSVCQPRVRT